MAESQVLCQQLSFQKRTIGRQPFSRPPFDPHHNTPTSHQFDDFFLGHDMAQPMLLNQYGSDNYAQHPAWPMPQASLGEFKPTTAASTCSSSNALAYSANQDWDAPAAINNTFDWHHATQMEPYIMSESEGQFRQNNEFAYNPMAAQNMGVKGMGEYGGQASWVPSGLHGVPREVSANGSDLDTNTPSPKSFFSDDFETAYSPALMSDQASPDLYGYQSSGYAMKRPMSSSGLPSTRVSLPGIGHGMPMANGQSTPRLRRLGDVPIASFEDDRQARSEYSCSQGSSPDASPWYQLNYSHDFSGLPLMPRHGPNDDTRRTEHRSEAWNASRLDVPAQNQLQARFQVPRSANSQAQRQHNDKLLVQGKKDGLTYKEIRGKMIGEAPAESTLRGRYRSLTKARKDRVRKPVWTKHDEDLLNEVVGQELDRIESSLQNPHALKSDQKLLKVPWKKVAEYIASNGGSYHFGNSTCKRKWIELKKNQK